MANVTHSHRTMSARAETAGKEQKELSYSELRRIAIEKGVFRVGMTKKQLAAAIRR
jgi:hypothetical protein